MTAKTLKNPALREKFHVGDIVHLPREVWTKCTNKMVNLPRVEHIVMIVGDRIIHYGKNHLCRFAIELGEGTSSSFKGAVVWEEWMLEKIVILSKGGNVDTCAIEGDETTLPPHL